MGLNRCRDDRAAIRCCQMWPSVGFPAQAELASFRAMTRGY